MDPTGFNWTPTIYRGNQPVVQWPALGLDQRDLAVEIGLFLRMKLESNAADRGDALQHSERVGYERLSETTLRRSRREPNATPSGRVRIEEIEVVNSGVLSIHRPRKLGFERQSPFRELNPKTGTVSFFV